MEQKFGIQSKKTQIRSSWKFMQTSTNAADPTKILQLLLSCCGKNSIKSGSWSRAALNLNSLQLFRYLTPLKNFIKNSSIASWVVSKNAHSCPILQSKNSFKNSGSASWSGSLPKSNHLLLVINPTFQKISPVGDWRSTSLEWPWPWPWFRPYGIPSCITHRPLPIYIYIYIYTKFHWDRKKNFFEGHHWGFGQVQSHVTQKLGQISKIRPNQI